MKNSVFLSGACMMALAFSACTQPPAEVVYKGSVFFGRDHEDLGETQTFDENAPRYKAGYAKPVQEAAVSSVSVSDLPPPNPTMAQQQNQSFQTQSPSAGGSHILGETQRSAPLDVKEPQVASLPQDTKPAKISAETFKGKSQFIWPVDGGKIISHFDSASASNDGINIAMSEGEPIFAAADGVVVYAGNELQGYGNMVIIKHADGWMTAYAHARSLAVKKGDKVKQTDLIAYVGSTGGVKTPQIHFALRKGKTAVDPEQYLPHLTG